MRFSASVLPAGRVAALMLTWPKLTLLPAPSAATSLYGTEIGTANVLVDGVITPPALTLTAPVPAKVVPAAVSVPATAIAEPLPNDEPKVSVSPAEKLAAPLTVTVWLPPTVTGTLTPTARVAPSATVNPPGKT